MLNSLKSALFGPSKEDLRRDRKRIRRGQERTMARSQSRLQERETALETRVGTLLESGRRAEARQLAGELAGVRADLVRIQRFGRQMAGMDSRAERAQLSAEMSSAIHRDTALAGALAANPGERAATLERYNAMCMRLDMMEETFDDIMEEADEIDESGGADAIIAEFDDRVAMGMRSHMTNVPGSRVCMDPSDASVDTTDAIDADVATLQARFDRLKEN